MKIIITGSHFTPAQAVIEVLRKNERVEIVYLGRQYTQEGDKTLSVESQVIREMGIKFLPLTTGRLQRALTVHTIPSLLKIPFGFMQAFYYLFKERPRVILSFGGYIGLPVVIAGWLLSIPIIIHEQTLVSGLSNQIASFFADKIAVSFTENQSFKKRTVLTGNPIRKEVISPKISAVSEEIKLFLKNQTAGPLPLILITGGNQGSHVINETVFKIINDLIKVAFVVHQTGDSKYGDYEKLVEKRLALTKPEQYLVKKWFNASEWGLLLKKADLVISRAGINTLLELAYFCIPTLAIPVPYLYKNEQMVNAKFFTEHGLVKILPQSYLTAENLWQQLSLMLKNLAILKNDARQAKKIVINNAADRLALETVTLIR